MLVKKVQSHLISIGRNKDDKFSTWLNKERARNENVQASEWVGPIEVVENPSRYHSEKCEW